MLFFKQLRVGGIWAAPVREDFEFRTTDELYRRDLREVNPKDYDLILIRFPYPVVDGFF